MSATSPDPPHAVPDAVHRAVDLLLAAVEQHYRWLDTGEQSHAEAVHEAASGAARMVGHVNALQADGSRQLGRARAEIDRMTGEEA